jgi:hypothetical protein
LARSAVFHFGVVLLAVVTGRFSSQYMLNALSGANVVNWAAAAVNEGSENKVRRAASTYCCRVRQSYAKESA